MPKKYRRLSPFNAINGFDDKKTYETYVNYSTLSFSPFGSMSMAVSAMACVRSRPPEANARENQRTKGGGQKSFHVGVPS